MTKTCLFDVDPWVLRTHRLHKDNIRLQESLTSLGNGYMGMRGNFEELYSGDHHQGTYLAGIWYPDKTKVGWWKNGYPSYFGKMINAMNIIGIKLFLQGEEVDLYQDPISNFNLVLNMKKGILKHSYDVAKGGAAVHVEAERFLSIVRREICAVRFRVTARSEVVSARLVPYLDSDVRNEDANYDDMFWLETGRYSEPGRSGLSVRTIDNPFGTPVFDVAAAMGVQVHGEVTITPEEKQLHVGQVLSFRLNPGDTASVDKFVAVTTSRDYQAGALPDQSKTLLGRALASGYDELKKEHVASWQRRWEKADITIDGDDEAQQGIRFNEFQLFSTYYGDDARLNIGPKGFTGEKYGGATYWDTEAFVVPFYLAVADSHVAKQLLLYRYHQLEGAYYNAQRQGLSGALYPMVTFTGIECHNEWEITFEEIHRNGAIAYAIYNYVNYTGDRSYIYHYGIDVLVAVSRFWADRVHFAKRKQKYMIHGVTGPNEYENNVNNNWYTNLIAAWTLEYTLGVLRWLDERKYRQLHLSTKETNHWRDIIDHMYYPYDEQLGIFEQNDTFLDKDIQPAAKIPRAERPINQHWSWDRILRSCFIKQADVLQGIYFFDDRFSIEEKKRNFEFYEPLTVHESSLSACIHSILASELGKQAKAMALYKRTARLDLDNYNNDTEDGLHITSMTGSWLAIVQGFAGMRSFRQTLSFAPYLPKGWTAYTFMINYRGRVIKVTVDGRGTTLRLQSGDQLPLKLFGKSVTLSRGQDVYKEADHP
ncbi:MAG: glycoside hydrolase family 65 protein [Sporolactobacillus sp.]|jgi:maltose phosphorylase|nr:glycoside hydrolase family 65 protein [Sporolactobacillus sp.]